MSQFAINPIHKYKHLIECNICNTNIKHVKDDVMCCMLAHLKLSLVEFMCDDLIKLIDDYTINITDSGIADKIPNTSDIMRCKINHVDKNMYQLINS